MFKNLQVLRVETMFRRLLLSGLISGIGDWFNTVAVMHLLERLTNNPMAVGLLMALKVVPFVLFGTLGGYVADRFHKKQILIITDFASAICAALFLFVSSSDQVWLIYVAMAGLVFSSLFNSPARAASIRQLVRRENLLPAAALNQMVGGAVMVLGAALGGVVAAAFGAQAAFVINAVSFLLSGLLLLNILYPNTQPEQTPASGQRQKTPMRSLWPFWKASRFIQVSTLYITMWAIGGGMMNVLTVEFGEHVFNQGQFGIGILYGAFGIGMLCGGLLTPKLRPYLKTAIIGGYLLEGVAYLFYSESPNLWVGAAMNVLALLGVAVANACNQSVQLVHIPPDLQGRVFALNGSIINTVMALSMLVGGSLLHVMSPRAVGVLASLIIIGAGLVIGTLLSRMKMPQLPT